MSAPHTARAIARAELTRAIPDLAGHQLAEVGPAALSVRRIARELDMASSAVYRYFPSRDALLTAPHRRGGTTTSAAASRGRRSAVDDRADHGLLALPSRTRCTTGPASSRTATPSSTAAPCLGMPPRRTPSPRDPHHRTARDRPRRRAGGRAPAGVLPVPPVEAAAVQPVATMLSPPSATR